MLFPFPVWSIPFVFLGSIFPRVKSDQPCATPYNTFSAISAMGRPDFERDPCYINWKNEQDKKLNDLWKRRDELEKSIAASNQRERENREKMYREREETYRRNEAEREKAKADRKAQSTTSIAVVIGLIVAVCACGGCYAFCKSDEQKPVVPSQAQVPAYVNVTAEMHPLVPTSSVLEQPHHSPRPRTPVIPETIPGSVPALKIPAANEDNPPSYAEAITMPSAPLQEELLENTRRSKIPGPK